LTVTWSGGTPPYTVACDMGGGTTENIPAGTPATSPFTHQFTLIEGTYTYTVTVTDAIGVTGTASHTYTVAGPGLPNANIDNVSFADGVLTVEVSSYYSNTYLDVSVTVPAGLAVDRGWKAATQTTGTAIFYWSATDVLAGGSGETQIEAYECGISTDWATQLIEIPPLSIPDDTLVAVASTGEATVGGEVTVVVACGDFPPDKPFQYMNGVAVTVEEGATYVDGTYNVGAIGGEWKDSDGLWGDMSPLPGSYLLPDDFMLVEAPVDGEAGRIFIGFNVTPIGGGEVTTGGAVFNFGLTFDQPGTYTLGFLEFQDVKRTYYSDGDSSEYFWSDALVGVQNTIDVT